MATQKVALITAGTAGLGAQVARMLAPDFRIVHPFHPRYETALLRTFQGNQLREQRRPRQSPPRRAAPNTQHNQLIGNASV